jgi:hypothetical protein
LKTHTKTKENEKTNPLIYKKLNPTYDSNRFDKHELYLLSFIEKEFLNEYRQKLVTYKALKFRENER